MPNTVSLLEDFIRIPSFVGEDVDESAIADRVAECFVSLPKPWFFTEQTISGTRRNLYVANSDSPKILFTAHLDTVPPSDTWTRDPFVPVREGSRLYGLGAVDMKAGLAAVVSLLLRNTNVPQDVAALFYVGEEYDFCGMNAFVNDTNINPTFIVNPEPTDMRVFRSCRGVMECRLIVLGRTAHAASLKNGVNAIDLFYRAVETLKKKLSILSDDQLGASTVNVAWVKGGLPRDGELVVRPNMVPSYAEAVIEIRTVNINIDEALVQSTLAEKIEAGGGVLSLFDVSLNVGSMSVPIFRNSMFDRFESGDPKTIGYFDTQLFIAARGGMPIVYGPGPSSVAHSANEYVDLRDLSQLEATLSTFLRTSF